MSIELADTQNLIRAKVLDLRPTHPQGRARDFRDSDLLPETGLLDSAGIMELVVWFEETFGVSIPQHKLTLENFGTIDAMTSYLQRRDVHVADRPDKPSPER